VRAGGIAPAGLAVVVALLASAPGALAGGTEEDTVTVSLGYAGPTDPGRNPAHRFAESFAAAVAERSGGRLALLLFPEDQLGTAEELTAADAGELGEGPVLAIVPGEVLERRFPPIAAACLPFLYDNRRAARTFFDESVFFERVASDLPAAAGLRLLSEVEADGGVGFSTAERVLRSPADFEGLALITRGGRYAATVESFGARPVGAGAAGADGWVGTEAGLLAAGLQDDFAHRSDARVAFPRSYLVVDAAAFEALGPEDRRLIEAAAAEATRQHRAAVDARVATVRAALEAAGVSVYVPGEAEREEFRRIAQPAAIDELDARVPLEWITRALEGASQPNL
jgi:TRAP-type C4-dicarboxylate transport system substrate-binding protein